MGNYVIGVGNYVIVSPSELGNCMIADTWRGLDQSLAFWDVSSPEPQRPSPSHTLLRVRLGHN
jgi:hypothetical protein